MYLYYLCIFIRNNKHMTISFDIVPRTLNKFDDISFLFSEYREFYGIKDCNCESKNSLKKD